MKIVVVRDWERYALAVMMAALIALLFAFDRHVNIITWQQVLLTQYALSCGADISSTQRDQAKGAPSNEGKQR